MSGYDNSKAPPLPTPAPNPNARVKKQFIGMIVKHEGKWMYRKKHVRYDYDAVLRKWIRDKNKDTVEYTPISELGVLKTQSLKLLVSREGIDPSTVRKIMGFFVVKMQAEVPDAPEYKDVYLTVFKAEKHGRRRVAGHFVINDLAENKFGYQKLEWDSLWITRVGQEKRVTSKEAQRLMETGEVADIISESATGEFTEEKWLFNKRI